MCVLSESPAWAAWVHTKRQLCHGERSISALGLFSVFLALIHSKENSTFTCHFSFPKRGGSGAAKEHPACWATMPAFSRRALWLSEWQAEKSRSAGMCVYVYDYTWWEEDVLFKRAVRLGSGKCLRCGFGSRACFHIHNSTGCKGGVIAFGLSVVQAHIRPNTEAFPGLLYAIMDFLNDACMNVMTHINL